jgi:hypothetical protein
MHAAAPMWRYGGRNGLKIQRFTREAHYLSLIYGQYDCLRMLRPLLSVDQVKLAIAAALRRLCARYAIKAERTRHKRLVQLLAAAVDQCGQVLALKAATQLHKTSGICRQDAVQRSPGWVSSGVARHHREASRQTQSSGAARILGLRMRDRAKRVLDHRATGLCKATAMFAATHRLQA